MSDKKAPMKWFGNSKIFQKIKSIKHIEIIIAVLFGAIVLLIYFSTFNTDSKKTTSSQAYYTSTNFAEYSASMESKMCNVLRQIKGAGNVSVMISFASGSEYVYAETVEEKTNTVTSSGTTTSTIVATSTPVLVSVSGESEPVIKKEILPKVEGVIIISSGASDIRVKLEMIKAVETLFNVPTTNIEVLVGK